MKILVTGSRDWPYHRELRSPEPRPADFSGMVMFNNAMAKILALNDQWDAEYGMPSGYIRLVVGDCPTGLDFIAQEWCANNFVPYDMYIARWDIHGKAAGPIRNQEMVDAKPAICIGFPKPGSGNRGTLGCMKLARKAGIFTLDGYSFSTST